MNYGRVCGNYYLCYSTKSIDDYLVHSNENKTSRYLIIAGWTTGPIGLTDEFTAIQ